MIYPNDPSRWLREVLDSAPLLQALLDKADAACFVKDLEGRYVLVNRAARRFLGGGGAIEGRTDLELLDRQCADTLLAGERRALETGGPNHTEVRLVRGDRTRVYSICIWPVFDSSGQASALCGMATDITERKRAEDALQQAERKFRELVESVDGIVWEQDARTFAFTYVSHQAERLLGYPTAAWFASPGAWERHLHPDDRDAALAFCRAETRAGRNHSLQYRMFAADGRVVWLRDIITVVRDGDEPVALRGVMVDVSEAHRTEERLRDNERRLELALEGAGLYFWDLDVSSGRIEYAGDFPASLGYGPEEVASTGEAWAGKVHPDDLPGGLEAWKDLLRGLSKVVDVEMRVRAKDGAWRWIQIRGKVVERSPQGRALRVIGTDLDVTERHLALGALRQSEERFRATFEQVAVGMAHFSAEGLCLRSNRRFAQMTGYAPAEIVGMHFATLTHPDDQECVTVGLERLRRGELEAFQLQKRYRRKDGSYLWGETTVSTTRSENGGTGYFTVVCNDITARIESERRLQELQSQLQLATSIAGVGFWEQDARTNAVYFSPAWKAHLGFEDAELPNRYEEWASRVHPDDWERVQARDRQLIEGHGKQHDQFEYRLRHKDGSYRWILSRAVAHRGDAGTVVKLSGTHLDITERKEAEDRIRAASQHDPLTGLPNRALIYDFGERLLAGASRTGSRVAVLFVDLDRFKPINDTHGHHVGDKVLKEVARRLRGCVRGEDLVGRLGGDEFLAVLAHLHGDGDPVRAASKVLAALGRPCRIGALELEVSPSIGIALYPQDGRTIEALIRHADAAMFHAKESGRNNYQFFRTELNERVAEALRIESRLKRALDDGEFVLFYQPIVDTESEAVVATEALLRWPAMQLGPDRFIPVAETAGFMQPLGAWVLREACRQQKEWRAHGLPALSVAVNVSATQFRHRGFFGSVSDAIAAGGLGPGELHVEVTESAVMTNVDEAAATLHALREQGVKVALDDFGTGYSSLSHLRRLPLDILKVDKSFVSNLAVDPASLAIADAIIALGETLGLEIIAEGVESGETAGLLKRRQCRRGQGYHYCRPIPAREFESWFRRRHMRAPRPFNDSGAGI